MIIIVHAEVNDVTIQKNLGLSEYSYYFVLKEFLPVLEKLGIVVKIRNPDPEVDAIFQICQHLGELCVFLSFSPPHYTPVNFQCPTFSIFAWEFYDIPTETWDENPRNDWRFVLKEQGAAITHCTTSVAAVQKAMGTDYPIIAAPAPVWNRFAALRNEKNMPPGHSLFEIKVNGSPIHFRSLGVKPRQQIKLTEDRLAKISFDWDLTMTSEKSSSSDTSIIQLNGVVYTTIFNPDDGRKNWLDILRVFCVALKDKEDAILIIKIIHHNPERVRYRFFREIQSLIPFSCQIIFIESFLNDANYQLLVQNSTYVVNASLAEGQCLPLMEFMSCGTPAIAPKHTGMKDYLDDSNAFLVDSSLEPTAWPQDPRQKIRTTRHRINAQSLLEAYQTSYRVAKEDWPRYQEMSRQANESLCNFCSQEMVEKKLKAFLDANVSGLNAPLVSEDW